MIRNSATSISSTLPPAENAVLNPVSKRAFDVMFSAAVLIFLAPLLAFVAAAIYVESGRPVYFRQERQGWCGRRFTILKFRTMRNADAREQVVTTDIRITRVGSILRRSGADELPQFWNVLIGDMSVVGPRPHAIWHEQQFRDKLKGYEARFRARPGVTGLAQVNNERGTATVNSMRRRLELDLEYIESWSFGRDLVIALRTVCVLFGDICTVLGRAQ
jgi:putative colanic acid biosynthesis UDP-glucose lipid carrier transferase